MLRRRRGGRACAGRSPTSCRYCALPSEMVYLRPTPLRHKGGGNKDDSAHQCEEPFRTRGGNKEQCVFPEFATRICF